MAFIYKLPPPGTSSGGGGGGGVPDDDSVSTVKIQNLAVTAAKIANTTVTGAKMANATVTATQLASDAVTTVKILDANVTTAKLATGAVTATPLASDAVTTVKILNANVTAAKLASDVAPAVLATKLDSGLVLISQTLTTGTTQPLSLADALFTGIAGGGSVSGSGTVGAVSVDTASSSVETGAGSGQAGLGANTPLADAAFAGQRGISVELLRTDGEEVLLINVLSTAIVDVNAKVYGYLAHRTDLAANSQWRLWFYYRRASDGVEVAFTPNASLTNASLYIPRVFSIFDKPVATGLGAALLTGQAAAIGPGAIGATELATNAVTTVKITDANVTTAKLATGAVTATALASDAVTTVKILDANVTAAKLASSSVTAAKLSGTTVDGQKIVRSGTDLIGTWMLDKMLGVVEWTEDFDKDGATSTWVLAQTGAGAGFALQGSGTNYSDATHTGWVEGVTGSTNTGVCAIGRAYTGGSQILASTTLEMECYWIWRAVNLPSGGETYTFFAGYGDSATSAAHTDGIWIDFAAGNYFGHCMSNGTVTDLDLGVGQTAATAQHCRINVNGAGGAGVVTFYTEEVSRGTISTNIPTGAGRQFGIIFKNLKSVGTTSRGVAVDFVSHRQMTGRTRTN